MRGFAPALVAALFGVLAWAGSATGVPAQALAPSVTRGRECRPPAASPAGFQDCRTGVADGRAVCRCRIVPGPGAVRRSPVDEAVSALPPRRTPSGDAAAALH